MVDHESGGVKINKAANPPARSIRRGGIGAAPSLTDLEGQSVKGREAAKIHLRKRVPILAFT
jgi:hypothetical protein